MKKKKITILVLTLFLISQIFLIFAITKIENPSLKNDTWERATKTKTELPQLSLTQTTTPNGLIIRIANYISYDPEICSDGADGAIITWYDYRSGSSYDIYAQRINSSGSVQWTADGVVICKDGYKQLYPEICSDGAGGAIITWYDYRSGNYSDIYAQRINSSGNVQWTADGVAICAAPNNQISPEICSDGAGGAIIMWQDYRSGSEGTSNDIYAQNINSSGNVQWTTDGVAICTESSEQSYPKICSDEAGGAIITWHDYRNGYDWDIYAQRINSSGNVHWTADGVIICNWGYSQTNPQIWCDGAGGAIITWKDSRGGYTFDTFAQRIDSSGNVQWTANGVAICTVSRSQKNFQICSDGAGGWIITWEDISGSNMYDIYAQRIASSGNIQWTADGVAICTDIKDQFSPEICSDGAGGAIITWHDYRNGYDWDIYAQRINSSGNVQWTKNGVAICTANDNQFSPEVCSDSAGGAIITWYDHRNGSSSDIYAQRIDSFGNVQWTADGVVICTVNNDQFSPESGEIPFEIIIVIASFIGIAAVIGIATTLIIKKRRKIE